MLKFTSILAIFALLSLFESNFASAAIKSFQKSHNYPQKHIIYNGYTFKEGNLVYGVCEGSQRGKKCMIMQERYPDGTFQRSCNITVEVQQANANLTDEIYMSAFGKDNVILFWDEIGTTTLFKLLTVKMDNCQTGGFTLPDPSMEIYEELLYNSKIITYDDTFEMFLKSSIFNTGADDTESVMIVNSRGIIEKNTTDFIKTGKIPIRSVSPIAENSPTKSYVYSKDVDDKYVFMLHKSDGSDEVLASYDGDVHIYYSMVNDLITLCVNSSVVCTQYDKEGNLKFTATFDDIKFKERVASRDLYNLPGGGFLIALCEYDKSGDAVDFSKVADYSIVKMNGEGKKVGSLQLKELVDADNEAKAVVSTYVWKNGSEGYCAAVIGQGINQPNPEDEPSDLNVVVNCFTDADLVA